MPSVACFHCSSSGCRQVYCSKVVRTCSSKAWRAVVKAGRHSPNGEHHFAERGAVTKQLQCHLRVWQFAQGLKDTQRLIDPTLRVRVAEVRAADGATKELEVAIADNLEVGRELSDVNGRGGPADQHELAFVLEVSSSCAELQANVSTAGLESADGSGNSGGLSRQTEVVQVGVHKFKAAWSARAS